MAAPFAGATRVIVPEIEHRFAEMFDDVGAIEIDVFDQCPAFLAVENHVFVLSGRAPSLDHNADRVRRPDRGMGHIRWNEKSFPLAHEMIDNAITFADPHFDVALELIKIFFRIDEMKIIPRVRAFDHHHEKIAPVVKVTVTHRRFEFFAVLFDPLFQINRRLNGGRGAFFGR